MQAENKQIGMYIHVPFCKAKCHYCDFNSFAGKESCIPSYFDALRHEIELYRDKLRGCSVSSVFIGGGTPSLVNPRYIYEVLDDCRQNFNITDNAEVSIEANPGTLSLEKLLSYKSAGINRLSIGLQAWQNSILKKLGRIHNIVEFLDNYEDARKAGFNNINVDLIFGLPEQSLEDWNETLTKVLELEAEHLSCYSLKIEEGTVFGSKLETGELIPIEDELDREMYYHTVEMLAGKGYKHYEISNFAKPGFECRHNMVYWKAEEYIGLGAGAHSYFEGNRFNNVYSVEEYTSHIQKKGIPFENTEVIDQKEQISEFMILGLRLIDGISCSEFEKRFGIDIFDLYKDNINKLVKKNLLEVKDGVIRLTSLGLDLANEVFMEFI